MRWTARAAVTLSICCAAVACGPRRPPASSAAEPVRLDPIHVKATREGDAVAVDAYDARELFARGGEALRRGSFAQAAELYAALVAEFPDSRLVEPALYNRGLALDAIDRFEEAAAAYRAVADRFPDSPDVEDAMFRLAGSLEKLERFEEVAAALGALLARRDLGGPERVEALARRGAALVRLGRCDEARPALEEATRLYRQGRGISPSDSAYYYSMAAFELGEIAHEEMRAVELPPDERALAAHLEEKARLLLEAQRLYTNVIRIGDPHWAAAAAYRIGALYHHLWKDMLSAPPPGDLDEEAKAIYLEILRDRTRVLLKKAVLQWERTLKLARRLQLENEWVAATERDLEEIRGELAIEEKEGMDGMDGTDEMDGGEKK